MLKTHRPIRHRDLHDPGACERDLPPCQEVKPTVFLPLAVSTLTPYYRRQFSYAPEGTVAKAVSCPRQCYKPSPPLLPVRRRHRRSALRIPGRNTPAHRAARPVTNVSGRETGREPGDT